MLRRISSSWQRQVFWFLFFLFFISVFENLFFEPLFGEAQFAVEAPWYSQLGLGLAILFLSGLLSRSIVKKDNMHSK